MSVIYKRYIGNSYANLVCVYIVVNPGSDKWHMILNFGLGNYFCIVKITNCLYLGYCCWSGFDAVLVGPLIRCQGESISPRPGGDSTHICTVLKDIVVLRIND